MFHIHNSVNCLHKHNHLHTHFWTSFYRLETKWQKSILSLPQDVKLFAAARNVIFIFDVILADYVTINLFTVRCDSSVNQRQRVRHTLQLFDVTMMLMPNISVRSCPFECFSLSLAVCVFVPTTSWLDDWSHCNGLCCWWSDARSKMREYSHKILLKSFAIHSWASKYLTGKESQTFVSLHCEWHQRDEEAAEGEREKKKNNDRHMFRRYLRLPEPTK